MTDVLMPRLSDTMEEGVVARWLKSEGDQVSRGDTLAEIETDKATMEMEAYDTGVLEKQLVSEGTTVAIGQPVAVIGDGSGTAAAESQGATTAESEGTSTAESQAAAATGEPAAQQDREQPAAAQTQPASTQPTEQEASAQTNGQPKRPERLRSSPLARRIARDHGIDISTITGSGPSGRVVRKDVEDAIAASSGAAAEPTAAAPPAAPSTVASAGADDEEVPLSAVRRITAQRLSESAQSAPHFYLTTVVDVGRLLRFRKRVNNQLAETGGKVSVNDLIVRAAAVALRDHPQANSSWGGDKIIRHHRIHVGIAVALEEGLIVPVIRDTDRKSLTEIAAETRDLATRARANKLAPDEFKGSTFTISNLGMYGIESFTAVINPPEAGILAVGQAAAEPVAINGRTRIRQRMRMTLSVDHRVLDGASGAQYLQQVKDLLEAPLRIVT